MIQLRKSVAVLAGVFLTGIFLIGCQNAQDMQPTVSMLKGIEAIAPIDQVEYEACTITFSLWGDEAADSEILAAVEVFEEKYPGMQVQIETGGKISDVNRFKQIIPEESFYNLYEAYDVLSLGEFGQENLNRCTVEERLQAVPSKLSVKTFLYNETLFEQAGLSVPDSLDDLLKAGNVFREKLGEDYYPLAMDQTDRVLFMIQYLQSLYGKNWTVDSVLQYKVEELMKGMELLLSMEEAHVIPSLEHLSQNSVEQGWTSGVYASVFDWDDQAGQYGGMLPAGATLKVGAPLKDINLCRGSIAKVSERYAVSESSEHKREATIFVDFLLNQAEGVVALAEEGTIPLSRAAREYYQEQGLAEEAAMQTKEQLLNSVMLTRDAELEGLCDGELPAAYSRVVSGLSYGEYNAREAAQLLMDEL